MPEPTADFTLPRPLQPTSHHAIGLHNAPIFEYDLSEFVGDGGRPLIVLEPRRVDGGTQAPVAWFTKRLIDAVNESYGQQVTIVLRDETPEGVVWQITRDIPVPVFDDKDDATMQKLHDIQAAAQAAGERPDAALQQAILSGVVKPVDMTIRKVLLELRPEGVSKVLTEIFSHHVEPAERVLMPTSVGFVGMAAEVSKDAAGRGPARPTQTKPAARAPRGRGEDLGLSA